MAISLAIIVATSLGNLAIVIWTARRGIQEQEEFEAFRRMREEELATFRRLRERHHLVRDPQVGVARHLD